MLLDLLLDLLNLLLFQLFLLLFSTAKNPAKESFALLLLFELLFAFDDVDFVFDDFLGPEL